MRGAILAVPTAMLVFICALLVGCGDSPKVSQAGEAAKPKPAAKTTAQTVVEGVTGKAAVDQGLSAREALRAVDKQRRKEIETLNQ